MNKAFAGAIVTVCVSLCACAHSETQEQTRHIFAMDTVMDITVYTESDEAEETLFAAENEIRRIDALLDRKNTVSEVYNINRKKIENISWEMNSVLSAAQEISKRTDGAFDITIAPVMDAWGFYDGEFKVPSDDELKAAMRGVGYKKILMGDSMIEMPPDTSIDLGGIGKGYASDRVAELLHSSGITSAVISLGGNVHAIGKRKDGNNFNIGITDPHNKEQVIGIIQVSDKAVVTSGGYQRYFESGGKTYHHIIDSKTGVSAASGLASVTIVADKGILADGLSTAIYVMGLEKGIELWRRSNDFEAVFVLEDGQIYITEGIKGIENAVRINR
ncbi:MAG: FAD:protein FMN transferase [Clostridia bacterium]|nr:FAD:protein FMN transferase [Clostridia bacterium]